MFLQACIISGCDYHPGVQGIGFKSALQLVKNQEGNLDQIID